MRDTIVEHGMRVCAATPARALLVAGDLGVRAAFLTLVLAAGGCGVSVDGDASHKINGAVHVEAGKPPGGAETVNGSIHIDPNAAVTQAATVNGSIQVGAHATAGSVKTVNGTITLEDGAKVAGGVESVNGALTLHEGADVGGALKNVAGRIELSGAHVGGGIRTVTGDVSILGASRVEGGIVVQKPGSSSIVVSDIPRIVIGPGASIQGDLRFEREVHLYVSDKASIGAVTGATPVPYTGDTPPG